MLTSRRGRCFTLCVGSWSDLFYKYCNCPTLIFLYKLKEGIFLEIIYKKMKNKLLLLSLGLIMTAQIIYSQVPSYVPSNGLVGYWGFNGNANDQSGNGNNGTVNGATLTSDRFGNNNSAYSFDGSNNHILVSNNSTLSGFSDITISLWINISQFPSASNPFSGLVTKWYGSGNCGGMTDNYACYLRTNNQFIAGTNQYRNYPNMLQSPSNLSTSNWYHLVMVHNSTTGGSIYINGTLVSTYNTSGALCSSTNPLYFGCDNGLGAINRFFNGKLDDIGIWNRALTQQEITAMYNGVNYSDTCNAVSGSLTNGLVGYWPFCGNANDDSGNGNNGIVNGATLTADRFGNTNNAYSFNGVSNLIKVNNSSSFNTFPMSISLWCKGNSQYGALISKYTSCSSNNGWQLHTMEGKASTYSYNFLGGAYLNCDGDSNTIISDNNWYNIVSTYDLSGVKIYVNNVLVLTKPYIGNGSMSAPTNIQDLYIGTEINSIGCSPYNTFYQGIIDDIGIWNRALTQQEITQLYNQNQCMTNITVTDTLIITVGQLSYSNPVTYANNITLYPNPANTQVNINFNNITDLTGGHINIVNSLGQQVATTPITLSGTNTTLGLSTWGGAGLYFVQIINAQGVVVDVKKIILQ